MININKAFSVQLTRVFILTFLTTIVGGPIVAQANDCYNVTRLDTNTKTERFGLNGTDVEIFEVEATDRGILTFSAMAPLAASADLKLALFNDTCRPVAALDGSQLIKRFTSEIVLHVETPGIYRFGVALQDPSDRFDAYNVIVRSVDDATFCESLQLTAKAVAEVEPDPDLFKAVAEVEPDPDLFETCLNKAVAEVEPDPDLFKAVAEVEPDPDLFKAVAEVEPDPDLLQITMSSLAALATDDDHAELFFFATPIALGYPQTANVDGYLGEDSDLFTFTVETQTTVRIGVLAASGMLVEFYNDHGMGLGLLETDSGSHLIKTLAPGRYYVRIEGSAPTNGPYQISVAVVDW